MLSLYDVCKNINNTAQLMSEIITRARSDYGIDIARPVADILNYTGKNLEKLSLVQKSLEPVKNIIVNLQSLGVIATCENIERQILDYVSQSKFQPYLIEGDYTNDLSKCLIF